MTTALAEQFAVEKEELISGSEAIAIACALARIQSIRELPCGRGRGVAGPQLPRKIIFLGNIKCHIV